MFDLLAASLPSLFQTGEDIALNFIGDFISILIGSVGIVGLGIIVFTVILRAITLPLDIYTKILSRKQSLKMEEMRPQLEKLQKQYADNQQLYTQKMQELYKQNHYSVLGACLPSIIMMVIFFVVFGAFNGYSQYTNLHAYNEMIVSYGDAIKPYCVEMTLDDEYTIFNYDLSIEEEKEKGEIINVYYTYTSKDPDRFVYIKVNAINIESEGKIAKDASIEYYIDCDKMLQNPAIAKEVNSLSAKAEEDPECASQEECCYKWVKELGREAAKETFYENQHAFLWIKNIWYPDTMFSHPVGDYQSFVNSITQKVKIEDKEYRITEYPGSPYATSTTYDEITHNLSTEKSSANGYFIMILLSVGSMFLSQFIMSKMQKAQTELQSADGSGQQSMKMMMIIMPIVYGFFSFGYSAAFSIYMVTANIFSIVTSLITTKLVDIVFKKKSEKAFKEKYEKRYNASKGIVDKKSKRK
ncbi:MAG: YidC/Oxa1 family membrane protein insertase [Clostridia bacterium]|nr:YidC/Oxa1 family membrane protein insertase [Clostridia bacterium]